MPVGGNGVVGRARLILALEAAFGGAGEPADDARVVFARIRVRMDDLIPFAKYVVTHPYGVTDELEADEDGRVFWTDDRGIADENFAAVVLAGRVAPFLRWDADAPPQRLPGRPRRRAHRHRQPVRHQLLPGDRSAGRGGPRAAGAGRSGRGGDRPVRRPGQDRHRARRRRRACRLPPRRAARPPSTCSPPARPARRSSSAATVCPDHVRPGVRTAGPTSRAYTVRVDAAAGPPGAGGGAQRQRPAGDPDLGARHGPGHGHPRGVRRRGRPAHRGGAVVRRPGPRPGGARRRPGPAGADRADRRLALRPPRGAGHDPGPLRGRRLRDRRR